MNNISDELLVTVVLGFAAVLMFGTIGYIAYRILVADRKMPAFPKRLHQSLIKRFSLKEAGFSLVPDTTATFTQGGWLAEFSSNSIRLRIFRDPSDSNHLNVLLAPVFDEFGQQGVFSIHALAEYVSTPKVDSGTDKTPSIRAQKTEMEALGETFTEHLEAFEEFFTEEGYEERRKAARDYIAAQHEAILTNLQLPRSPDGKWKIPPLPTPPPQFRRLQGGTPWSCFIPAGIVIGLIAALAYGISSNNLALGGRALIGLWALPWMLVLVLLARLIARVFIHPELKRARKAIYEHFPFLQPAKVTRQKFFIGNQVWLLHFKAEGLTFYFYGDPQKCYLLLDHEMAGDPIELEWLAAFHFQEMFPRPLGNGSSLNEQLHNLAETFILHKDWILDFFSRKNSDNIQELQTHIYKSAVVIDILRQHGQGAKPDEYRPIH